MSGAESYSYRCTQSLLLFYFCLNSLVLVTVLRAKFLSALQSVNTLTSLAENTKRYHSIKRVGYCYSLTTTSDKVNNAVNLLLTFCWKKHIKTMSADIYEYWNATDALGKKKNSNRRVSDVLVNHGILEVCGFPPQLNGISRCLFFLLKSKQKLRALLVASQQLQIELDIHRPFKGTLLFKVIGKGPGLLDGALLLFPFGVRKKDPSKSSLMAGKTCQEPADHGGRLEEYRGNKLFLLQATGTRLIDRDHWKALITFDSPFDFPFSLSPPSCSLLLPSFPHEQKVFRITLIPIRLHL